MNVTLRWRGESMGDKELLGTLRVTNYRIHFTRLQRNAASAETSPAFNVISIPLGKNVDCWHQLLHKPAPHFCVTRAQHSHIRHSVSGTLNRCELAQARSGRRQEIIIFGKDLRLVRIAVEAGKGKEGINA